MSRYKLFPLFQVLHKQGDHNFRISMSFGEEDENGVMRCTVPGVMIQDSMMSAMIFEEVELMERIKSSRMCDFVPVTSFRKGKEIIGVGNFLGKTANMWIKEHKQKNELWTFDTNGEILTPRMTFSAIIRMVAKELTRQHKINKPLGFTCRRMYINGKTFKLSKASSSSGNFSNSIL